jgi:hypothetical protein
LEFCADPARRMAGAEARHLRGLTLVDYSEKDRDPLAGIMNTSDPERPKKKKSR